MTPHITMRELVLPQAVVASLNADTKKDVLKNIAGAAATLLGMDELTVFDVLWERERLGSTGVGQGLAIPHGRVPGLEKVFGLFARLPQPIDFESVDGKPVDLVFLLLAPESAGADHLQALASVSRLLRDSAFCEKLRKASDAASLYKLLIDHSEAQAA